MTGIGMAAASGKTVVADPFAVSLTLTTSSGTDHVNLGSGDLYSNCAPTGNHLVGVSITGGTPPYTNISLGFTLDGASSGADGYQAHYPGVGSNDTIYFTGIPVGGVVAYHLDLYAEDSAGHSGSARWPTSGSALILRDS